MKNCLSCYIGLAFIIAKVLIALNPQIKKENKEFIKSLTVEQFILYQKVVAERKSIYFQATIIGLICGFVMLLLTDIKNNIGKGCLFTSVVFIVQYFWYILSPKHHSMVEHLDTKKQRKEWEDVYRSYQHTYHIGLFVGIVGYFLFGYGF